MTDKVKFEAGDPAEEFSVLVNLAMAKALKNEADVDTLAIIAANTAYELYEHYGAGKEYDSYPEFVVSTAFQADEVDQWLEDQAE